LRGLSKLDKKLGALLGISLSLLLTLVGCCLVFALFVSILDGCRGFVWLSQARIQENDFESVRSTIEPHLQPLFEEAEQEFLSGYHEYRVRDHLVLESPDIEDVLIVQFVGDGGTTYNVLFAIRGVRGFGGGYYYTPSGNLPTRAPFYGVVCSMHMEGHWYAFNTVSSENPPDPRDCPEDIQYRQR
jgi:hypothetical protein